MSNQTQLPFESVSVAQATLDALCNSWLELLKDVDPDAQHPSEADTVSLACLYVCRASSEQLKGETLNSLGLCLVRARMGKLGGINSFQWLIAASYAAGNQMTPRLVAGLAELLAHDVSGIRWWFHHVGWVVREDINEPSVRDALLQNMADKLGYVEESAGLFYGLHKSLDEVNARAEAFQPSAMPDQYASRIEQASEVGWDSFSVRFFLREQIYRDLIWTTAAHLPTDGL